VKPQINSQLTGKISLKLDSNSSWLLCYVYPCRFDNQVLNEKLVKNYVWLVNVRQYIVYEEDRNPA